MALTGGQTVWLYNLTAKSWFAFLQISRMPTAWTKTNTWWRQLLSDSSYSLRSKILLTFARLRLLLPSSLVWLPGPLSRGFLFLWASRHHTLRGLPAWEGIKTERGKPLKKVDLKRDSPNVPASFLNPSRCSVLSSLHRTQSTKHVSLLPWKRPW